MSKVEDQGSTLYYSNTNGIRVNNFFSNFSNKKKISNYTKMQNIRIIQKKLVYVIGLSAQIAFKEVYL